jgi:steroid delta-isomerase-like uncharacterized protein
MNKHEMKALIEQDLQVWNDGDVSVYDEILHPDFVRHEMDIKDDMVGIEANKKNVQFNRTAFPDFHVSADNAIFIEDTIVMRWTLTGTHLGDFAEIPPTGRKIKLSGVSISKIVNGKVREQWCYYNQMAGFAQIGFTFTPPKIEPEPQL